MESNRQRTYRRYEAADRQLRRLLLGQEPIRGDLQRDQDYISVARREAMKKMFIFVNGILSCPEDVQGWTDRAESWIETNTEYKATKMEYFTDVVFRRLHQEDRVNNLKTLCERYHDHKIILVGHSNGCDIILRLIQRNLFDFHAIHLIAGACEKDFDLNKVNNCLRDGSVGKACVYWSKYDRALKKAKLSTRLFGWLGLGYGYLGLVGPVNVDDDVSGHVESVERRFDHSQWFSPKNFDELMNKIAA
jgi:predicted alpha/beta hydrolase family esterase